MSDIGIDVPLWLAVVLVGVEAWPVALVLFIATGALAVLARGGWRVGALLSTGVLALDLVAAGLWWADNRQRDAGAASFGASVHSTLDVARVVDGLALPAGTEITWTDPSKTALRTAAPPQAAVLFGLTVDWVEREQDGGWSVTLGAAQAVDGWTCQPGPVRLDKDGHLRGCSLAAATIWNGWPIPAGTLVQPGAPTSMVFPTDAPVTAREIGRVLPATGAMSMNADGSLDQVYFEPGAPLALHGVALWNTVRWEYAAASFGQGRVRPAIAVTGTLAEEVRYAGQAIPSGTQVSVRLADTALTIK